MYPYNFKKGQTIQTDVNGVACDRVFPAHFQIEATKATAQSNINVHAAIALTAEAATITTAITQPSVPRNIVIKGNAAGIVGNVVINGKNYLDEVITETIALNGATAVVGAKAFKAITNIVMPIETHAGTDTVSVGTGEVLGLPYKLAHNTVLATYMDNTLEGTAAIVTISATAIESNTIDPNTALSGKVVDVYLLV